MEKQTRLLFLRGTCLFVERASVSMTKSPEEHDSHKESSLPFSENLGQSVFPTWTHERPDSLETLQQRRCITNKLQPTSSEVKEQNVGTFT